jgi:hypothetical protein
VSYQFLGPELSTLTAAADYSAKQYHAVDVTAAATTVTLASVAGQKIVGILQNAPSSGGVATVQVRGVAKAFAGGTVAINDDIIVNSSGKLIAAANSDGYIIGTALSAASSGEVFSLLITHRGRRRAHVFNLPITLANITGAGDVLTDFTPGFSGRIVKTQFSVSTRATTASKAVTLNLEIGTADLTGGTIALTTANCGTLGAVVAGTAVTAANTFSATDTISVEASSVTAFAEGAGTLHVTVLED